MKYQVLSLCYVRYELYNRALAKASKIAEASVNACTQHVRSSSSSSPFIIVFHLHKNNATSRQVAPSDDCSSNIKQHAYELLDTPTPNLSPPTLSIRWRRFSGQNIHYKWTQARKIVTDFPYMLSFANASDMQLVNRPKMAVFC